jgi:superfamily II DNA or RNA helicase
LAELATELDQRINFRVYSKIEFAHEDVSWQDLEDYSGNCKIEYAQVRFSIVPESPSKSRTRKQKSRETDDSDTLYVGEEARRPHVEAKITRKWLSNMAKMEREKGVVRQLKGKSHPNIMTFFESESPVDK